MELHPGVHLGSYEVLELLGQGGMGSVYRARDTRLGREVAIKIIRPPFAEDADRLARFTREARLLASLNHPHIATIHGLEECDDVRFLVLELVPGLTLAERVAHGPLAVREALVLAAQIADAVGAAHDRGIIHRDLKPANIKVTPDGSVKVLDFGLAKALAPDSAAQALSDVPTITQSGTAKGIVLGTAAYMSPEQARGQEVDRRTDIWAFGCVLFDLLTGREAFACDTLPDTLAAILTRDPEWARLPAEVPSSIRCMLRRALEKDPNRRLHDLGDARLEIEDVLAGHTDQFSLPAGASAPARIAGRRWVRLAGSMVAVAALTAAAVWTLKPSPPPADHTIAQFALPLPPGERLDGLDFPAIAMSPAGTNIVYVASRGGESRLVVRTLSALEVQPIDGTEGALSPFFSPDGQWVGFFAGGKLKKVQVTGGPVHSICDAPIGFGGTWSSDGTIVFAPDNGSAIWQVSADGGTPQAVTKLDAARGEFSHRWPELLPGGGALLYTVGTQGSWDDAEIVVQSLKGGERRSVVQGGTNPKYLLDGRLLYGRGGSVFAAPFDAAAGRTTAAATPVLTGVFESTDGAMQLSVSRAGSIAYVAGVAGTATRGLVWVDRQGNAQPLAAPERPYSSPRLAPDGRSLAVTIAGTDRDEVWTYDIARNELTEVTHEGGESPVWTSDGARIIFSASRGGPASVFWKRVDGSGPEERLTSGPHADVPNSSSADGRSVAVVESDLAGGHDIVLLNGDDRTRHPFLSSPAGEMAPAFSPDGLSMAYVSDESGRNEVYVTPLKDPKQRIRVSTDGGTEPVWRRDGRELFFRAGNRMLAAEATLRPSPSFRPARVLFEGEFDTGSAARPAYDVSADGARFLMVTSGPRERAGPELRVILGWAAPHRAP